MTNEAMEAVIRKIELRFGLPPGIVPRARIIAIPSGEAPYEVRSMWVGVEFPIIFYGETSVLLGVLSGEPDQDNIGGFSVSAVDAIALLEVKDEQGRCAAQWWKDHGFDRRGLDLTFGPQYCQVVAPPLFEAIFN